MFGIGKKAQPKDSYEQPEIIVEEVPDESLDSDVSFPVSPFTGESFDPEWGEQIRGPKANPGIIGSYWK